MKIARSVWWAIAALASTGLALGNWFWDYDTEQWMVGILWLFLAFTEIQWALDPWIEDTV